MAFIFFHRGPAAETNLTTFGAPSKFILPADGNETRKKKNEISEGQLSPKPVLAKEWEARFKDNH